MENKGRINKATRNVMKGLTFATSGSNFETSNLYSERNLDANQKRISVMNKTDY